MRKSYLTKTTKDKISCPCKTTTNYYNKNKFLFLFVFLMIILSLPFAIKELILCYNSIAILREQVLALALSLSDLQKNSIETKSFLFELKKVLITGAKERTMVKAPTPSTVEQVAQIVINHTITTGLSRTWSLIARLLGLD